jgi:nicotinamide riboside kinase
MTWSRSISVERLVPTRRTFGIVLVALAMVLAGCGGGGGGGGGGEGAGTTAEGTTAGGETTASSGETTSGGETTTAESTMNNGTGMDNGSAMANGSDMSGMANASLRIAHMSPDAPAVDVYLDNQTAVSGVEFSEITDYLTVPAGQHTVTITAADNRSAVVFNDTVSLEAAAYTVAATGEIGENASQPFAPLILQDSTSPPANNASVRLAHVSPDAPPVDVTIEDTNTTLFDNVTYGNATEYLEVPAGEYTLEVRAATASDNGTVVDSFDVDVENGTAYTAFAAGYVTPDDEDADAPLELIATPDGQAASLRAAHMSPDAPAVDVYLDNETAFSGVEFSQATDYAAVTPGNHTVTITAADNRSAVVFNDTVALGAGAYTVAATGEIGENASQPFAPLVLDDNTTAPSENTSKVRLVHAVPDAPPVDVTVEDTNTTLFDNVTFGNASEYAAVPGGEYTLEIRPATANDSGPVVTTVDVDVENGTTYTAFAAGYLDPANASGEEPLDLVVLTDSDESDSESDSNGESESNAMSAPRASSTGAEPIAVN